MDSSAGGMGGKVDIAGKASAGRRGRRGVRHDARRGDGRRVGHGPVGGEVVAGGEMRAVGGQHDGLHARIMRRRVEGVVQRVEHREVLGVAHLGAGEGDPGDACRGGLVADRLGGGGGFFLSPPRKRKENLKKFIQKINFI